MLKKFGIWIIKNLIILILVALIFSALTLDVPNLIKGVFGDIFEYASPDMQKQVVGKLTESCSSLDRGENLVTIIQICNNRSLFESMQQNCKDYTELKKRNAKIDNEESIMQTCSQIESGELEKSCGEMSKKSSLSPDFSRIGSLCKEYNSGNIDDKQFFFNVINSSFPNTLEMPKIGALEKYNSFIDYLNGNKILYFLILSSLGILLYILIRDTKLFLITLSGILFKIGVIIVLPYVAILAYDKFARIDTTQILGSIFGSGNVFNFKAIASIILLLFLRTYTNFILVLGIIFLAAGISGKIYGWKSKRRKL